ncbi:MAG: SIMPL domain-containing protein [Bacteroidia bacterium]
MIRVLSYLIIGVCLCIGVSTFSKSWEKTHFSYQSIKVTGMAKRDFTSDLVAWSSSFSRKAYTLAEANAMIKKDIATVKQFLMKNKIREDEITFSALQINREFQYKYDAEGRNIGQEFTGFNLTQSVQVETKELTSVENAYKEAGNLLDQGIEFIAGEPDYYYSKLSDLKIDLLSEATKDGFNRASKIAENAEGGVGRLKNASMGVIQITGQNSTEDYSWDGAFNTKAKNKTATVTVKLEFEIK